MTDVTARPTEEISVRDVFGIDTDMRVKGFADRTDRVPVIDPTYKFDPTRRWRFWRGLPTTGA